MEDAPNFCKSNGREDPNPVSKVALIPTYAHPNHLTRARLVEGLAGTTPEGDSRRSVRMEILETFQDERHFSNFTPTFATQLFSL